MLSKRTQSPGKFNHQHQKIVTFTLQFRITNLIYTYLLTVELSMNKYTCISDNK